MARSRVHPFPTFPEAAVRTALGDWWDDQTSNSGESHPFANGLEGTVFDLRPVMDSLRIVEALVEVEELLGVDVPDSVVRRGGYGSLNELFEHMVPRLRTVFERATKAPETDAITDAQIETR